MNERHGLVFLHKRGVRAVGMRIIENHRLGIMTTLSLNFSEDI